MASYRGVSIVYGDNHLLVVVKPPNMPTQADDSGDADLHSTMKAYIAERYQQARRGVSGARPSAGQAGGRPRRAGQNQQGGGQAERAGAG